MEDKIISEIRLHSKGKETTVPDQDTLGLNNTDLEDCLSILSSEPHPIGSSMNIYQPASQNFSLQPSLVASPQVPSTSSLLQDQFLGLSQSLSPSLLQSLPQPQFTPQLQPPQPQAQPQTPSYYLPPLQTTESPRTPVQQQIQKLLCAERYKNVAKAGEFAVRLAVIFYGEDTLKRSGLGDNQGKLNPLDSGKMEEIEAIIKRVYRGKGNIEQIWKEKCRTAIAKKCQRLRSITKTIPANITTEFS